MARSTFLGRARLTLYMFDLVRIDVFELVHYLVVARVEIDPNGILFRFELKQNSGEDDRSLSAYSSSFGQCKSHLLDVLLDVLNRLPIGIS